MTIVIVIQLNEIVIQLNDIVIQLNDNVIQLKTIMFPNRGGCSPALVWSQIVIIYST